MRCCVQSCSNDARRAGKVNGITFHTFPKDQSLRKAWMESLGLVKEPKEHSTICSEHFNTEDFYQTRCGLKKIKNVAVPFTTMDLEDLNTPAELLVCRICLGRDTKMYHIGSFNLDRIYGDVTNTRVTDEDRLPKKVCWECAHRLQNWAKFRHKVLHSFGLMTELLKTTGFLTLRDIAPIDRTSQLQTSLVQAYRDGNDFDASLTEDELFVKPEEEMFKEEIEMENYPSPEPDNVEIKDEEQTNEIFIEEFKTPCLDDAFESDDDKKLSEVVKKKGKEKKRKCKVEKVEKVEKVKKVTKKKDPSLDDDSPSAILDKYKTSDVKRRKHYDGLDESLFSISQLSYEEQMAEVAARAENAAYRSAPYKCALCFRGFLLRERYLVHAVRHSEASGAYECFICKTRLKSGRALRKHLTAQHTEKYSCKGCPFATRNRGVAREHVKWHAGTKYQCPHCPSEFDKITTYMGHIRIKHVSHFVCELCGFTFVSKKGVDVHKKKKHRLATDVPLEGPYCELCDVKFLNDEAHERHLKLSARHSSDSDPNRIRNDSQSAGGERAARERRAPGDAPPPGPVTCEQCGVQLRDLRLYAQHFRRAHPDKNRTKYPAMKTPAMCEQCGRIFQSMALLKDHMWVHTGEKRFKCDRCDKSFTQKTNLVFHMRVHSATRPTYECPLCGKHFAFYNNRRRHMFIHTGLKPFKCPTCAKCFTTAGELRAHVEHVHLKKPWPRRARARAGWGHEG